MFAERTKDLDCRHPSYERLASGIQKVRVFDAGRDSVVASRGVYFPNRRSWTDEDLRIATQEAEFPNYTEDAIDKLKNILCQNELKISGVSDLELDNLMTMNLNFSDFFHKIVREFVAVGRVGVLTKPTDNGPKWEWFKTEEIINWEVMDSGAPMFVIIEREFWERTDEESHKKEKVKKWIVLHYNENGNFQMSTYIYDIGVAQEHKENPFLRIDVEEFDSLNSESKKLDTFPFYILSLDGNFNTINKPPRLGLAHLHCSYWAICVKESRLDSIISNPILYELNARQDESEETAGGNDGNSFSPIQNRGRYNKREDPTNYVSLTGETFAADAKYVGADGASADKLSNKKQMLRKEIDIQASRLLEIPHTAQVEATETHKIRRMGDMAVIRDYGKIISRKITELLNFTFLNYLGQNKSISFEIDTEIEVEENKEEE